MRWKKLANKCKPGSRKGLIEMDRDIVLSAVASTEPSTIWEFFDGLGEHCPAKCDRQAWREVYELVEQLGKEGLMKIYRDAGKKIVKLQLTEAGAETVRELLDRKRGLLEFLKSKQNAEDFASKLKSKKE